MYMYIYIYIYVFCKIGVPPNHPELDHFRVETCVLGFLHFRKPQFFQGLPRARETHAIYKVVLQFVSWGVMFYPVKM